MPTDARGVALIDTICSLAIIGILAAIAVPIVAGSLERERATVGARVLAGYAQRARFEALRRAWAPAISSCAIFSPDSGCWFSHRPN